MQQTKLRRNHDKHTHILIKFCVFSKDIAAMATVGATVKTPTADRTLIYTVVQITANLFVLNIAQTMLHAIFSLHLA